MLEIKNVNKFFGGLKAVNNVSLNVSKGSITGLIGPNGAGKTTLFNTIAGVYSPSRGNIFLEKEDISGLKPHELFTKGVLRTFQIAHEFSTLTVLENLMMVPSSQYGEKLIYALFNNKEVKKQEDKIRAKAIEVISFLNLKHLTQELAGNLSGGQKKLLELGRTMMVEPRIVLLDEVGAGVNRTLLSEISDAIKRLNKGKKWKYGYDKENDVVVAISASGNSPNIIEALNVAKNKGIVTVGISAFDGGKLKELSDISLHVPTDQGAYGPSEDVHMILDHLVTGYLMSIVGKERS